MTRKELISSPTYWLTQIQLAIFRCADKFMTDKEMNRTKLAEHLGVTKGQVSLRCLPREYPSQMFTL